MVVRTDKTTTIASMPLLNWYADIFRPAISAGDVRLSWAMVLGMSTSTLELQTQSSSAAYRYSLGTKHPISRAWGWFLCMMPGSGKG